MTRRQRIMLIVLAALFVVALAEVGILRRMQASADKDAMRYAGAVLEPLREMDSLVRQASAALPDSASASNPFPPLIDLAQMLQSGQPVANVRPLAMRSLPSLSGKPQDAVSLSHVMEALLARALSLQDSMVRMGRPVALTALDLPFTPSVEEGSTYHHLMVGNVPDPLQCWLEPVNWHLPDSSKMHIIQYDEVGMVALATLETGGLIPAGQDSAVVPYLIALRRIPGSLQADTISGTFTVVK